jgi:hypothetical protein
MLLSVRESAMPRAEVGHPRAAVSDHAIVKAELLGFARTDVEAAVVDGHRSRKSNTGAADWLVEAGRLAVAYNHPDGHDEIAAFIVTLWRRT